MGMIVTMVRSLQVRYSPRQLKRAQAVGRTEAYPNSYPSPKALFKAIKPAAVRRRQCPTQFEAHQPPAYNMVWHRLGLRVLLTPVRQLGWHYARMDAEANPNTNPNQ